MKIGSKTDAGQSSDKH